VRELSGDEVELRGAQVILRTARPEDAAAMHALAERSGALEVNSAYCYLLLADHFRATSVVAEREGEIVGMVVGYRPPTRPEAIFVWQVGVDDTMRGRGLGRAMLHAFATTPGAAGARFLEATVTPANRASRALFHAFARDRATELHEEAGYPAALFPGGHEPERLLRIGPLSPASREETS
jgi:diaminobutyrate acetyltransferase